MPAVRAIASMQLGGRHAAQLSGAAGACLVLVLWHSSSRQEQQVEAVILQPVLAGSGGPINMLISSRTSRQRSQLANNICH